MKSMTMSLGLAAMALTLALAQPAASDACCWRGCGWRSCGWGGWGGCGWGYGGCGWRSCGYGCGWGGCGWGAFGCARPCWGYGYGCAAPVCSTYWEGPTCGGMVAYTSGYAVPVSPTATVVLNDIIAQDPPLLISPPRYAIAPRVRTAQPPAAAPNAAPPQPNVPAEALPAPAADPATSRIEIRVPTADAEVWFSGHKTRMAGTKRVFETPALERGRSYSYQVVVKWIDAAGKAQEDSYKLDVSAGKQAVVAFGAKPGDASSWVASRR